MVDEPIADLSHADSSSLDECQYVRIDDFSADSRVRTGLSALRLGTGWLCSGQRSVHDGEV